LLPEIAALADRIAHLRFDLIRTGRAGPYEMALIDLEAMADALVEDIQATAFPPRFQYFGEDGA
jgi:hypothetical protein